MSSFSSSEENFSQRELLCLSIVNVPCFSASANCCGILSGTTGVFAFVTFIQKLIEEGMSQIRFGVCCVQRKEAVGIIVISNIFKASAETLDFMHSTEKREVISLTHSAATFYGHLRAFKIEVGMWVVDSQLPKDFSWRRGSYESR